MIDQPTDQLNDDVVDTDQPHDHDDHDDHAPADQPTNHEWATLEEAATALDITVNAVRQRLKRGTLAGVKTNSGWLVELSPTDQQPTSNRPASRQPTNHATTATDQQPTIDLTPLVNHVAALEDQVRRLTEATTMWQIRARQAEEQLLQLQAGPVATDTQPDTPSDAPGAPQDVSETLQEVPGPSLWERLRRMFAGD